MNYELIYKLLRNLRNGLAYACIRLLNMQQLTDGGGDVGDVHLTRSSAMRHFPTHEEQGYVGIVGIPQTVGRTHWRRPAAVAVIAGLQDYQDVT